MTNGELKHKIHDALKQRYFDGRDDLVDVSDGPTDSLHLVVVSRKFDNHPYMDRINLVWDLLERNLAPEECEKVTLTVAKSPEDIKDGM
jgi:stress-induced morphogen